jgi:hypothetical protein
VRRVQVNRVDLTELEIVGLAVGGSECNKANKRPVLLGNKHPASALVRTFDLRDPKHGLAD